MPIGLFQACCVYLAVTPAGGQESRNEPALQDLLASAKRSGQDEPEVVSLATFDDHSEGLTSQIDKPKLARQ